LTRNVDFTGIFAAAGVHDNCVRGCFASFEPETRGAGRSTSHFLPFAVDRGPASRGRCLWPFDSKLLCGVRCVRPHGLGAGRRRSDQQSSMLGNSISSPVTSFRGPSCFAPLWPRFCHRGHRSGLRIRNILPVCQAEVLLLRAVWGPVLILFWTATIFVSISGYPAYTSVCI